MKHRAVLSLALLPVLAAAAQPGDPAAADRPATPAATVGSATTPAAAAGTPAAASLPAPAVSPATPAAASGSPPPDAAEAPAGSGNFTLQRADVAAFIREVSARNGLEEHEVRALLRQAQPQPKIIEIMERPVERIAPWWEYRARFLTPERISDGAQFWTEHRESVERAAAKYQVPPEYLVAILGVETFYGRLTGRYRVLDALATLGFDYPPRGKYFRGELEQFLLLCRDNHLDPLTTLGSYAGAMGAPQFMPSTYRHYAVDADNSHRSDLWGNWDDILASIANYLHEYGWQPGTPVLAEARLDPDANFQIDPRNVELNETIASLAHHGVRAVTDLPPDTKAVLIWAEQREGPGYRVGFHNFRVITRYNTSPRYAMAVHDLAQAIAQRMQATPATVKAQ
ncbi:MAG: lytic murein transglycosylase B [Proteobacteria bacterium]|nr:lytic murein transglycosylase B [Pseudomonadota bacterium]